MTTTNVESFLGAQQEWMTSNLPKEGSILEVSKYRLPKKAERVYGKTGKSDHTGVYLNRDGEPDCH